MVGTVRAIAAGSERGKPKEEKRQATFFEGHGLIGDVHAGAGPRQVGLLSAADFDRARKKLPDVAPGSFAENLIVEGMDFSKICMGDRLRIGSVLLEITERGKAEWKRGDYSFRGLPLLARKGLFARVLAGGKVRRGHKVEIVGSTNK